MADRRRRRAGRAAACAPRCGRHRRLVVTPGQTEGRSTRSRFPPTWTPTSCGCRARRRRPWARSRTSRAAFSTGGARSCAAPRSRSGSAMRTASTITPATPVSSAAMPPSRATAAPQVDADGRYAFRTIRPVAYPGPHAAYPLQGACAGGRPPDHPDVRRRRAPERHRRPAQRHPRPPRPATALIVALARRRRPRGGRARGHASTSCSPSDRARRSLSPPITAAA